jgi:DNA gyrase subunit B
MSQAQINHADFPENVRLRKEMYIYSKEHMIYELIDNSVDEAAAGRCSAIAVAIMQDSVTVEDNGGGIPVTPYPDQKKFPGLSQVEVAMTTLHAGGKLGKAGGYSTATGGLHGVGASCVNALSSEFIVKVKTGGIMYQMDCKKGIIVNKIRAVENVDTTGTEVTFKYDDELWSDEPLDIKQVQKRLEELAYLNPGLLFYFIVDRDGEKFQKEIQYNNGLVEFIERLRKTKEPISDIIGTDGYVIAEDGSASAIAIQYTNAYDQTIVSFCNNIPTTDGGDHEAGFKAAITNTVNKYAIEHKYIKEDAKFSADDLREGMIAIVSVKVKDPKFEGQAKAKLRMPNARKGVKQITEELLEDYLDKNPDMAKAIINKASEAIKAREAARRAREASRNKAKSESLSLPGKLAACISKKPEETEIYFVEGDSAGGSAKQGRNRNFQAILPMKGKILNVEKQRLDVVLNSEQIQTISGALGCGIGEDYKEEKLRYHKMIIMSDADVDGFHIQMLFITFFYRYLKPVIEKGYLYLACPPLYKVTSGKDNIQYAYDEEARDAITAALGDKKYSIGRFKGLGEMNSDELWKTTMDPETRTLIRVTMEDAEEIDRIIEIAMGSDVGPRRDYIAQNAEYANLDV